MQYAIKNVGSGALTFNGSLEIFPGFPYLIYDSESFVVGKNTGDIIASLSTNSSDKTQNLNYCLANGLVAYCVDGVAQTSQSFYQWFGHFMESYSYYKQYEGLGLVNIGLDTNRNKIIVGTRAIQISDLPTKIPATYIADGSVDNSEFVTLNGIDTSTTIQAQLDSKLGINTPRNYTYTQVTPSKLWTISHKLGSTAVIPMVYDSTGSELLATITIIDKDDLSVGFSIPTAGVCVVSF